MGFKELLSCLSKSSPLAVATRGTINPAEKKLKDFLHVKTDIEQAFIETIDNIKEPGEIIFLCGSSGDGKSELLRRHVKKYEAKYTFHLDATHSFDPEQNAITALDRVFRQHKINNKPLVVGINIGMLENYALDGSEEHKEIKTNINNFLHNTDININYHFLNFENFPRFALNPK